MQILKTVRAVGFLSKDQRQWLSDGCEELLRAGLKVSAASYEDRLVLHVHVRPIPELPSFNSPRFSVQISRSQQLQLYQLVLKSRHWLFKNLAPALDCRKSTLLQIISAALKLITSEFDPTFYQNYHPGSAFPLNLLSQMQEVQLHSGVLVRPTARQVNLLIQGDAVLWISLKQRMKVSKVTRLEEIKNSAIDQQLTTVTLSCISQLFAFRLQAPVRFINQLRQALKFYREGRDPLKIPQKQVDGRSFSDCPYELLQLEAARLESLPLKEAEHCQSLLAVYQQLIEYFSAGSDEKYLIYVDKMRDFLSTQENQVFMACTEPRTAAEPQQPQTVFDLL